LGRSLIGSGLSSMTRVKAGCCTSSALVTKLPILVSMSGSKTRKKLERCVETNAKNIETLIGTPYVAGLACKRPALGYIRRENFPPETFADVQAF
jgi:hypothetical protein